MGYAADWMIGFLLSNLVRLLLLYISPYEKETRCIYKRLLKKKYTARAWVYTQAEK